MLSLTDKQISPVVATAKRLCHAAVMGSDVSVDGDNTNLIADQDGATVEIRTVDGWVEVSCDNHGLAMKIRRKAHGGIIRGNTQTFSSN